ncbi:MAG TPA: MCE family protein [Amycolatopsis sp.]|uniref:MCE family protein n=1 Tax=Amycolatopsis sp. TaxID=37632 RepID=UPI002B46CE2E|nr:MCE family protein [Amycolatopsis sp.]HKS45929.1 MCE family protein [Amycolatopsis sp.]
MRFPARLTRLATIAVVLALFVAAGIWWTLSDSGMKRVTAYFTRAVGVYPGSDVRLLGVRIGQVDSVTPRGDQVQVTMSVEPDVPVAASTEALIVSPSVVADRYVQFTRLSTGGAARLPDGAVIAVEHTGTPVELDQLYSSLDDLVKSLGPDGANAQGALSNVLDTAAKNLDGNGKAFNDSVRNFADLSRTLSDSKDDLFGTVDELQKFTGMLAGGNDQVQQINQRLAQVWQTLSADRTELSAALATLGGALADIQEFIRDNRALIKANVDKLAQTTQVVVTQRASVAEALDSAPLAATDLLNAFDPTSGTLQGRANLLEFLPLGGH